MKTKPTNNDNIDILEEEDEEELKPFHYYEQTMAKKIHHFYLCGPIREPYAYVEMFHKIGTSNPEDLIYIHLNTPGGDLTTGVQLANVMRTCQGHVICSLEGEACSLGSLIFLAADEFLIHENTTMMIHNFSSGTYGKGNEQYQQLEAAIKWFKKLATDYYIPFINEEELGAVLRGEDLWLQADEIRKRLNKMIKIKQKEAKS
jgi:ATP-dependent protease ClpP protease subunit